MQEQTKQTSLEVRIEDLERKVAELESKSISQERVKENIVKHIEDSMRHGEMRSIIRLVMGPFLAR